MDTGIFYQCSIRYERWRAVETINFLGCVAGRSNWYPGAVNHLTDSMFISMCHASRSRDQTMPPPIIRIWTRVPHAVVCAWNNHRKVEGKKKHSIRMELFIQIELRLRINIEPNRASVLLLSFILGSPVYEWIIVTRLTFYQIEIQLKISYTDRLISFIWPAEQITFSSGAHENTIGMPMASY